MGYVEHTVADSTLSMGHFAIDAENVNLPCLAGAEPLQLGGRAHRIGEDGNRRIGRIRLRDARRSALANDVVQGALRKIDGQQINDDVASFFTV